MAANSEFFEDLTSQMLTDPDGYAQRHKAARMLFSGGDQQAAKGGGESRAGYIPRSHDNDSRSYTMGLGEIDRLAGRLGPAELVAVAASTGHGKSSFGEHVALEISLHNRVVVYSLEMGKELAEERLLSKIMRADLGTVKAERRSGGMEYDFAVDELRRRDLHIIHPSRAQRSLRGITTHAENMGADVAIIDYAGKLKDWRSGEGANDIVNELWDWVQESRITTFLLSQTKRPAQPGGKRYRPTVHDFSASSEIENCATRAVLIWRPFHLTPKDTVTEITIAKNRFGREFRAHAHWTAETADIHGMTAEEEALAPCCRRGSGPPTAKHLAKRVDGASQDPMNDVDIFEYADERIGLGLA